VDVLQPRDSNEPVNNVVNPSGCHYDVLIAGASIAGLCMAARAKALGLSYLLVEKNDWVGDNWSIDRYDSLKLHTSKNYNALPYEPRTFRKKDPYHLGTKDLADGFKRFVDTFGIEVMLSTELASGTYDSSCGTWALELKSKNGTRHNITAAHCVLAVGSMGVKPNWPQYPGREKFGGDVVHGLHWRNADSWQGKRAKGVCVGSANTAHGVCCDSCIGVDRANSAATAR
jgi:cation diffusion facilitator CzcD-associated flavoprotein CzcO